LGVTHFLLGIVILSLAFSLLTGGTPYRDAVLFWSGVVVAYSCASEATVLADKLLPAGADAGSSSGTLVAVGLLVASSIVLGATV
jgi:hypothetical protein